MLSVEDVANNQTAWEKAEDIKGGLPLLRRSSFPEYLSTGEIASLLFESPEEKISGERLLHLAINQEELRRKIVIGTSEPVDLRGVVRSLHAHIRILEDRLKQFQEDIVQTLEKNVRELEKDIYATRDSCAAALQDEIEAITEPETSSRHRQRISSRIRSRICGNLTTAKTRIPLRGGRSIGYSTTTQGKHLDMIHKDDMEAWLKSRKEWPLPKHVALSRWFVKEDRKRVKPLVKTIREEVLKMVARDLIKEGKDPLAFQGHVEDIFELCKQKAVAEFGSEQDFIHLATWRTGYWHKRSKGIMDLADSRSRQRKS